MKFFLYIPLLAASIPAAAVAEIPKEVTFNAHIRPIFSNTCFACHGFDSKNRKAELRLDTPEGAYAKLKDSEGYAIVAGKPDESEIMKRLYSTDPEVIMPPPEFHKKITPEQKLLIRAWIEQGAKYEQHWAFAPIVKPTVPPLAKPLAEATNPIDHFILATLAEEHREPVPLADKATLLRRLSLDLIGLPPTLPELDGFLADTSADAYERQVDRLLASPHYGERMAVPWLDVVRFADTVGYHGDQNLRVFPYRDYIIKSFNDNKPFDQFTAEQLAGDLMPGATDEQRIATGFLRLNLVTREGGAQAKEYLAKSMGDRVRSVGATWLGLTTGCAECHDHKFDPITAKDFYSLGAFFADVRQWGVYADYEWTIRNLELPGFANDSPFPPEIYARSASAETRLLRDQDAGVNFLGQLRKPEDEPQIQAWADASKTFLQANPSGWETLTPAKISTSQGTPHEVLADNSVLFTGLPLNADAITLRFPLPITAIRAIRFEVLPDAKNQSKVGRQANGKFTVTPLFSLGHDTPLKIAWSQADRSTPLAYVSGDDLPLLTPVWQSAPAIWEEPQDAASLPHQALYHLAETLPAAEGRVLEVTLATSDIGRVRFSISPFGDAVVGRENAVRSQLVSALNSAEKSGLEITAAFLQSTTPDAALPEGYRKLRDSVIACRAGFAHSVVAQAVPADKIPATHLLPRGAWMNPGEIVAPAVPAYLPHESVPKEVDRLTRLDLAHWLTSRENPLVARHFCNRLWRQFFGKGLSNVLDDLGNQGEWPSHAKLLDWLAIEFQDAKWDMKHMIRLLVTSRTYRQQSAVIANLAEVDPANRLLAEQSPRRLEAEFIRDNALAISGLLNDRLIGGPSIKPYQPENYYANITFPDRDYIPSPDREQYSRGLYMHWQRTFMHPMLAGFDAPSREECTADRFQSNSPQQALTLLNDPSFVEAARSFALRIIKEQPGSDDSAKINHAMKLAVSRVAKPSELDSLSKLLTTQRESYKNKPDEAKALLAIGQSDNGANHDPAELAAWTQLCRVILNLHETITRY